MNEPARKNIAVKSRKGWVVSVAVSRQEFTEQGNRDEHLSVIVGRIERRINKQLEAAERRLRNKQHYFREQIKSLFEFAWKQDELTTPKKPDRIEA